MRSRFDEQLERLNNELIHMGSLCENAIDKSAKALIDGNKELIDEVHELSELIERKEREIENLCLKLLLQQQPVAGDLRSISAALKMVTDMERIGRQSSEISDIILVGNKALDVDIPSVFEMADAVTYMVNSSIDAFVKRDITIANAVIKYDDNVDEYFVKIRDSLVKRLRDYEINGEYALDILMIVKYFERIGDHAENIANWVRFSILGKLER